MPLRNIAAPVPTAAAADDHDDDDDGFVSVVRQIYMLFIEESRDCIIHLTKRHGFYDL